MESNRQKEAIERILHMEQSFDALQEAAAQDPRRILEEDSLRIQLEMLVRYYEDGQWMGDYELDEKGLLPQNLKRGILSQDGIYNFLTQIREKNLDGR